MASIEKAIRERFSDREVNTNLTAIAETYKITKLQRLE
jgi:Pyruvate/2-oxoacid:ferredoxin oxidoreductase gamma subunit